MAQRRMDEPIWRTRNLVADPMLCHGTWHIAHRIQPSSLQRDQSVAGVSGVAASAMLAPNFDAVMRDRTPVMCALLKWA